MTTRGRAEQSQETCQNVLQLNECPRKGVRAAVGILLERSVPACPFAAEEVTGFGFQTNLECLKLPATTGAQARAALSEDESQSSKRELALVSVAAALCGALKITRSADLSSSSSCSQ